MSKPSQCLAFFLNRRITIVLGKEVYSDLLQDASKSVVK